MNAKAPDLQAPRVLIVGSGAMASAFAVLLAPHARISMYGTWQTGLDAIRRSGVRLDRNGQQAAFPVELVDDGGQRERFPSALVLVKAWQTEQAAERLEPLLAPDGVAVTLQNGLGNQEILAQVLGPERVAVGVTTTGALLVEPGLVQITGRGPVTLGQHPRIEPIARLLRDAGLEVQITRDISELLWRKLAINAGINPLTAILGVQNGFLVQDASAERLMRAAAWEAAAVAEAGGVTTGLDDPGDGAAQVARQTAANRSSMLQDVSMGRPTEIEAITGTVVRVAEQLGVDVPVNSTLLDLVRSLVHRAQVAR